MLSLTLQLASLALLATSMSFTTVASIHSRDSAIVEQMQPVTLEQDETGIHFVLEKNWRPNGPDSKHTTRSLVVLANRQAPVRTKLSPNRLSLPAAVTSGADLSRIHDTAVLVINYE